MGANGEKVVCLSSARTRTRRGCGVFYRETPPEGRRASASCVAREGATRRARASADEASGDALVDDARDGGVCRVGRRGGDGARSANADTRGGDEDAKRSNVAYTRAFLARAYALASLERQGESVESAQIGIDGVRAMDAIRRQREGDSRCDATRDRTSRAGDETTCDETVAR